MSDKPKKMNLKSMNISEKKKRKIKDIFPEVFNDGTIDFGQLKRVLGEWVDPGEEHFGLSWPGKAKCMKVIQTQAKGTLRPCKDESVNWDTTKNIFIEGDNLEVLKLLQKSYFGKIKMIYIDPPYNTGKEFIYSDKYSESLDAYLRYTGQKDSNGHKLSTDIDTNGRFHSKWLNMMYPRIYLARNFLKENGVFVAHIDEHESTHFKILLDEIFGSGNCLGNIVWDKKNPKGDAKGISGQHETILVYAKEIYSFLGDNLLKRPKRNARKMLSKARALYLKRENNIIPNDLKVVKEKYNLDIDLNNYKASYSLECINRDYQSWIKEEKISSGEAPYKHIDKNGNVYQEVSMSWPNKRKAPDEYYKPLVHPDSKKECPVPERGWRYPPRTMEAFLSQGLIIFGKDEKIQPRRKYLLKEHMNENIPSVLSFGGSDDRFFKKIGISFDNPKPFELSLELLRYFMNKDEEGIVIDFFAGSATTAHASMLFDKENRCRIKYICIQLPEPSDKKSEATILGYDTISSVAKERIKRSSALIKQESNEVFDSGFKSFKLDRSCFKDWDDRPCLDEQGLLELMEGQIDYLDPNTSKEDILYELLLKDGFPLTTSIERLDIQGKTIYSIESGALIICLERDITEELIFKLSELEPTPVRVVCLDAGFRGNDELKCNAAHIFKTKAHHRETIIDFRTV